MSDTNIPKVEPLGAADIVTRLREWGGIPGEGVYSIEDGVPKQMLIDAAAEIERLRAAGDALADLLVNVIVGTPRRGGKATMRVAISAWGDARRG